MPDRTSPHSTPRRQLSSSLRPIPILTVPRAAVETPVADLMASGAVTALTVETRRWI